MKSDRFTKIMLVLIFLALVANLFKSSSIVEWVYAHTQPQLAIERVGTRVYKREYYKHSHTIVCDCNGVTKKLKASTPVGMTAEEEGAAY